MSRLISETPLDDGQVRVSYSCPNPMGLSACRQVTNLTVPEEGWIKYADGTGVFFVQEAFPDLNADNRETIMTGMCQACIDDMYQ